MATPDEVRRDVIASRAESETGAQIPLQKVTLQVKTGNSHKVCIPVVARKTLNITSETHVHTWVDTDTMQLILVPVNDGNTDVFRSTEAMTDTGIMSVYKNSPGVLYATAPIGAVEKLGIEPGSELTPVICTETQAIYYHPTAETRGED